MDLKINEKPKKVKTSAVENDMPCGLKKGKTLFVLFMISFGLINFLIFYLYKNFNSLILAFQEFTGFQNGEAQYIYSFYQFKKIFTELASPDSLLISSLKHTFTYWCITTFIKLPLSYFIAYFLYKKIRGYKVFRIIFYLPNIISATVLVTIFMVFIRPTGPLDTIMQGMGFGEIPSLLNSSTTAFKTMVVFSSIYLGANFVLINGAMNRIPESIIESARLDGITDGKELVYIITPLVWPTLMTLIVLQVANLFRAGGPVVLMTNGAYDTYDLEFLIFNAVNSENSLQYPAAIGILCTLICLPVVLGVRKLLSIMFEDVEY